MMVEVTRAGKRCVFHAGIDCLCAGLEAEIERLTKILARIHSIAEADPEGNDAREAIAEIAMLSRWI